jgi:predicted transcriptional regulator
MIDTPVKPLLSLCAADIMSHQVVMVPREMSLQGAARMLARAGVTGAPVVDAAGRCIGVLSATDFMNWLKEEHPHKSGESWMCKPWQIPENGNPIDGCVEECMTKDPVLASPRAKIGELARMMMDAHVHRVIVVDSASRRPMGVVSSMDILAAVARSDQAHADGVQESTSNADTLYDM